MYDKDLAIDILSRFATFTPATRFQIFDKN